MRRRSKPIWSVVDSRVTLTLARGMQAASCSEEGVRVRRETVAGSVVAARARSVWPWPWVGPGAARAEALVAAAMAAAANRPRVLRCIRNGLRWLGLHG